MSTPQTVHRLTNLPVSPTSFVGRTQELADVRLQLEKTRLLTLTGPGGCGKTRLALQAASALLAEFANGVTLCDFATLSDPSYVPAQLAAELGVSEQAGRSITEIIIAALSSLQLLLVLDSGSA